MSLTKVSYSMINGDVANVLDFGADPTGTTNSSAAFTNAFATGKTVFAPKGLYLVNDVCVPGSQNLTGEGKDLTILRAGANCTNAVVYANNPFSIVSDLTIDGNSGVYTAVGFLSDGASTEYANFNQTLNNLVVKNCSSYGIRTKGGNAFTLTNSYITNCVGTLLYLDSAFKHYISDNIFELSASRGIDIIDTSRPGSLAASGGTISNNWFEDLTADFCIVSNAYNEFIKNNKVNTTVTTTAVINIQAGSDSVVIEQNNFQNGPTYRIQIDATAQGTKVSWNRGVGFTNAFTTFGILDNGTSTCLEGYESTKDSYALKGANVNLVGKDITLLGASGSSDYTKGRLVIGTYYFWVDGSGKFRLKAGAPTTDTDGTIVGTQT